MQRALFQHDQREVKKSTTKMSKKIGQSSQKQRGNEGMSRSENTDVENKIERNHSDKTRGAESESGQLCSYCL